MSGFERDVAAPSGEPMSIMNLHFIQQPFSAANAPVDLEDGSPLRLFYAGACRGVVPLCGTKTGAFVP